MAADSADIPPRESYLPRDEAALGAADVATEVEGGAELAADPFARQRVAVERNEPEAAALGGESLAQQVDEEFRGQSARNALEAAAEPDNRRDPIRGRYAADQPAEAIVTSGSYTPETETPRAGLRSRFPRSEEATEDGYDTLDRQPGHLHNEAGQPSGHAHARVTVENGKYTVQPNDNYWIISQKVYGDGGYFKAIYEHNRLRYPRRQAAGGRRARCAAGFGAARTLRGALSETAESAAGP